MTRQSWAPSGECLLALQLCGAAWDAASVQLREDHRERGPSGPYGSPLRCLRSWLGKTERRAVWCLSLVPAACMGPHLLLLCLVRRLNQECTASELLLATTADCLFSPFSLSFSHRPEWVGEPCRWPCPTSHISTLQPER